uniref:Uncharacterized protein n=1 Tax=Entomoneis paludosa TaxID=265537 RepID=A0A6U3BPQ6_9STRA|mmetsp:Transcript_31756/g.66290  ORF Transcript_31756/g.66290 Transcript_31756/m.66290 type:complete len:161 (+) Transcript_31756:64-546(+)
MTDSSDTSKVSLISSTSTTPSTTHSAIIARSSAWTRVALGSWIFFGLFLLGCVIFAFQESFLSANSTLKLHGRMNKKPAKQNTSGPWEECLWLSGFECERYIKSQVPSYIEIEFLSKDSEGSISDYYPNRVIIWLDDHDQVIEVPARGRRHRGLRQGKRT